jgi:hypothetical protein
MDGGGVKQVTGYSLNRQFKSNLDIEEDLMGCENSQLYQSFMKLKATLY